MDTKRAFLFKETLVIHKTYAIIAYYINDVTICHYFLLFRSKSIGAIFSNIETIVKNHNALSIPGTTSIRIHGDGSHMSFRIGAK